MEWVTDWIEQFNYIAVALVLFLAGLGIPIPEDIPLIYGGVMAHAGKMNVYAHFVISMIFILIGDVSLYMIGRRIALRSQRKSNESINHETDVANERRLSKLLTPERKAKVQDYFNRYGSWTVFFGRFIAGLRGAIFLSAGLTNFPLGRFILLDGLAALISVPVWIYLGYWAGSKWDTVLEGLKEYQIYVIATLALMLILGFMIKKIRNKSSQEAT